MHPEILSIALFWFVTAYTPGPNNVVASYSGFNFGISKTIPHILGVTLGFTSLVIFLTIGLINVFKLFPIIQIIIKYLGTLFLFYLAYKIASSANIDETKNHHIIFVTSDGKIRKNNLEDFSSINAAGKIAIKLDQNDKIAGVKISLLLFL